MNNKKGFTLVEVLVVITILGLLSGIAIISVSKVLNKNRLNYYRSQEKLLKLAGQTYADDNRNKMPKEVGNTVVVTLEELKKGFYINTIKDYGKKNCSYQNSYVLIYKISNNKYEFYPYLDCPDYKTDFNYDSNSALININLADENNYKNPTALVDITDSNGIASYEYIIYKNNKEVKNSGNIENKSKSSYVNFNVKFDLLASGTYSLTVIAYDRFNVKSVKSLDNIMIDSNSPLCGSNNGSTTWTNKARTVTVNCSDKGLGCKKSSFSNTWTTDTKVSSIDIEDLVGNITNCPVNVYVDVTKPTIEVLKSSGSEDNLVFELKDNMSGVASYQIQKYNGHNAPIDSDWISVNKEKKVITTTQEKGSYIIYVLDKANNLQTKNINVQTSVKVPYCNIEIVSGTKGNNDWYKTNVSLKMTVEKGAYSISNFYLNTVENPSSNAAGVIVDNDNKVLSTSINYETSSITYYGYVKDTEGNYGTCSKTVKIDKTSPRCGVADGSSTEWTNGNRTIKQICTDSISGCVKASYDKTYSTTTDTDKIKISDNAGNTRLCNVNVYVDKNAPICGEVVGSSTTWTNENRTIDVGCIDDDSGCVSQSFSKIYDLTTKKGSTIIEDLAGNKTSCSYDVYLDKIAPTCGTASGSSTTWTNGNRTIKQKCSDDNSGCTNTEFSKTYSSDLKTDKISISDNAGNTKQCNVNVFVDKTKPVCGSTASGASTTWTKKDRTLKVSCIDDRASVNSGCTTNIFSKTFSGDTKQGNITIKDNAGNTSSCGPFDVYVDKTPPSVIEYCSINPGCPSDKNKTYATMFIKDQFSGYDTSHKTYFCVTTQTLYKQYFNSGTQVYESPNLDNICLHYSSNSKDETMDNVWKEGLCSGAAGDMFVWYNLCDKAGNCVQGKKQQPSNNIWDENCTHSP